MFKVFSRRTGVVSIGVVTLAVFTLVSSLRGLPRPLRCGRLVGVCSSYCSSILTSITSLDYIGTLFSVVQGVVKYGLTTVERKLVGLLGSSTMQVSLLILRRVCRPDQWPSWLVLPSLQTSTSEFSRRLEITVVLGPFLIARALETQRSTRILPILTIAFLRATVRCVTVVASVLRSVIRGQAPNISSVGTRPFRPTESFRALNAICNANSLQIPSILVLKIQQMRRSRPW